MSSIMKLNHILILITFIFVSCDSDEHKTPNRTSIGLNINQNRHLYLHPEIDFDTYLFRNAVSSRNYLVGYLDHTEDLKFSVFPLTKLKCTISWEDNCVYYIYTYYGTYYKGADKPYDIKATKYIQPHCFRLKIWDENKNLIYEFSPNDPSEFQSHQTAYDFNKDYRACVLKGKLDVSPEIFLSKMDRLRDHCLQISMRVDFRNKYYPDRI